MANHKSAKKRIRSTARRNLINKSTRSQLRTLEKELRQAIEKKDKTKALEEFKVFSAKMDSSVRKGLYHKNKVNRKKSRLSALVNSL